MLSFPRSRQETSADLTPEEVANLLENHWGFQAHLIRRGGSCCVHYVDLPQERLVFRCNPGWDGPLPQPTIVAYVDHLSRSQAPAPRSEGL